MAGRDDRSKKIKKKRKQEKKIRNREGEAAAAGRGRKRETGEHRGTKWESWIRKGRQSFGVTRALMAFRASLMSSGATRRRHTPMAFIWPFLTVFVIIILHYNTKRNIKKGKDSMKRMRLIGREINVRPVGDGEKCEFSYPAGKKMNQRDQWLIVRERVAVVCLITSTRLEGWVDVWSRW